MDIPKRFAQLDFSTVPLLPEYVVAQILEMTIKSRRKTAGDEIVEALHGRVGPTPEKLSHLVWKSMRTGVVNKRDAWGNGYIMPFATMCFARGRIDILRALVAAGQPEWLKHPMDISPDEVADSLEHDADTPSKWLQALCSQSIRGEEDVELKNRNLFKIASDSCTPIPEKLLSTHSKSTPITRTSKTSCQRLVRPARRSPRFR